VLRHQIYERMAEDRHTTPLIDLCHEIHAVPETANVAQVLDEFIAQKEHFFLVIDEYGGTAGIITLEDTIESLLGIEITDETDVVADLRKLAQQRYQKQLTDQAQEDATIAPEYPEASQP
jgi:CBS domain containing-hemolysin-like protein